jgi:DNA-binding beta-propeller fold protein YncE
VGRRTGPAGSILVVDSQTLAVVRIDPATGAQAIVTSCALITHPNGLAVNVSTGEIYLSNFRGSASPLGNVVRIDPVTTEQRAIASGPLFPSTARVVAPDGVTR